MATYTSMESNCSEGLKSNIAIHLTVKAYGLSRK